MSRSHRPPKPRPPNTRPVPAPSSRTALGVVPFALAPPAVVLAVDRPLAAALVVAALAVALVVARRAATVAPRHVAVRLPVVGLRVEVGLARPDGGR